MSEPLSVQSSLDGGGPFSKLWAILPGSKRRDVVLLMLLMFVGMGLETLGVGLVIPVLAVLGQQSPAKGQNFLNGLMSLFPVGDGTQPIVVAMLGLVAVFFVKFVFLGVLSWRQMKFVFGLQAELSQSLLRGYLRQPWAFHLRRNSAELIRNSMIEVSALTNVTMPGLIIITELLVLTGIVGLLLAVQPVGAIVVALVLASAAWAFHRLTRDQVLKWGRRRQYHEGQRIVHLQQALGGVKEVKLLGAEDVFLAAYDQHNRGTARVSELQYTLQTLPRLGLELLAVGGLAALTLFMIWQHQDIGAMMPTVGLFAAASFRILPSVNRVISSVQAVRYALPVIDVLHEELMSMPAEQTRESGSSLTLDRDLVASSVAFRYEGMESDALQHVTACVPSGKVVAIVGSTGAGKSTLLDVLLGLLSPHDGVVRADGVDIQTDLAAWQHDIGYVPQSIYLTDDSLRRNVAFGIPEDQIDDARLWRSLEEAQLAEFVQSLPSGLETFVGERGVRLSGGQRQRIGIARALYRDPKLLVLDEATNALDAVTEAEVMSAVAVQRGRRTVIIVTHRLDSVRDCDYVYRLEEGRVVTEGPPDEVLAAIRARALTRA